jgi:histidinol-phosphate aminotransferase
VFRTFSKIYGLASLAIGYTLAPRTLAASLRRLGIGAFYELNRLSLVAANASLKDQTYVASIRNKVTAERDAWHNLFHGLNVPFADSHGNFVFFNSGRNHEVVKEALAARGIDIGRAYPQLDTWIRISIGLPEDNAAARQAVTALLHSP